MRKPCPLCDAAAQANSGSHPSLITTLGETHVVLGDNQGCRGWCVLILKHHAEHLADLDPLIQARVWHDVSRVASAIRAVFPTSGKDGGPPRINYECLGNLVPHIHWHIIPRHADDPDPTKPVWGWSEAQLKGSMSADERAALIVRLREHL
jgi:diadenosine tetraphosphate (Ap4A) HIT family hydrolase